MRRYLGAGRAAIVVALVFVAQGVALGTVAAGVAWWQMLVGPVEGALTAGEVTRLLSKLAMSLASAVTALAATWLLMTRDFRARGHDEISWARGRGSELLLATVLGVGLGLLVVATRSSGRWQRSTKSRDAVSPLGRRCIDRHLSGPSSKPIS